MNKRISTFQMILLCVFGAIGVAGILIFALATAGGSGSTVGPVTIWGTFDATAVKTVLRAAAVQDSRLSQVTYVQQNPATYEQTLANALASGSGPDIFIMPGDETLYDEDKVGVIPYSSLPQSQFESTFVSADDVYLTPSGVLALPILVDPLVLYWNPSAFANVGIPQAPNYWDEVPTMVQALTKRDDAGNLQAEGIALGTYENISGAKDILSMLIEQAGGQIDAQNAVGVYQPTLAQGGGASQSALGALEFYTEFANPSQSDYSWNDAQPSALQAFAAGNLAMYVGYASEESQIVAANPNLDFMATSTPQVRDSSAAVDGGEVYALAISRQSKNLESALTVAYLLSSEPVDQALSQALGLPPARRDAIADSTSTTGYTQLFGRMALITDTWTDPDPSQTDPIFQAMIDDTDSGAMTADDAIGRANQQIGDLLSQSQPQSTQSQ